MVPHGDEQWFDIVKMVMSVLILQLHLNCGPLKVPLVTDSKALAWCRQLHHGYRIGRSALS